jgi:hypothetical protein
MTETEKIAESLSFDKELMEQIHREDCINLLKPTGYVTHKQV